MFTGDLEGPVQAVKKTFWGQQKNRRNCLYFGLTVYGQADINCVEMLFIMQVKIAYTGNMKEFFQIRTLALLIGAKPQTLSSVLICTEPTPCCRGRALN